MATAAGNSASISSGRTSLTPGSADTDGGLETAISGWLGRTSRDGPHAGASWLHRPRTASAAPTIEEHPRGSWNTISANAVTAALVACTGIRLAPIQHNDSRWRREP